jgi:hypothetical protein
MSSVDWLLEEDPYDYYLLVCEAFYRTVRLFCEKRLCALIREMFTTSSLATFSADVM